MFIGLRRSLARCYYNERNDDRIILLKLFESCSARFSRNRFEYTSAVPRVNKIMTMSVFRNLIIGLCVFTLMGSVVNAIDNIDDLQSIRELAEAKDYDVAMKQLDAYLEKNPQDPQGRFLKGILFSDQKAFDEAIEVFVSLTEDYPELPEPYNNLAVLYAGRGKYLKARDALLVAIKTHPSYATAHENLGDIYAMMATEAYKKALSLSEGNESAKTKLDMIRDLFPKQIVDATNIATSEETLDGKIKHSAGKSIMVDTPSGSESSVSSSEQESRTFAPRALSGEEAIKAEVVGTLEKWAKAWSNKRLEDYIAFYAPTFIPADGRSFSSWKLLRRKRLSSPQFISVEILEPRVVMLGNSKVRAHFKQKYRSDTYQDTVRKKIEMVNMNNSWRFVREETN
uniref:Tetratricopeptide repeat-containing protein n=1 Tax=Candidatus Kentrum sp. SD TaxID=2126332 RepID=A0A450Z3P5_9GAMM|nr:MAG: Tetratricopeptide repeat-containing protein [Candidatus Kentron sp. SD]VFK48382.1 MAG: Tetratricopeptide repeat-containing protein [Candidatus Kentron sp. SD]